MKNFNKGQIVWVASSIDMTAFSFKIGVICFYWPETRYSEDEHSYAYLESDLFTSEQKALESLLPKVSKGDVIYFMFDDEVFGEPIIEFDRNLIETSIRQLSLNEYRKTWWLGTSSMKKDICNLINKVDYETTNNNN